MNHHIIEQISLELKIKNKQITETLRMLEEGNTIPFIARYRKEATGGLDEEQIRKINEVYLYQENLLKRKEDIIRLIDEKGMLTEEIKNDILKATKLVEVEDIYRPYKEKKKTKATEAIKLGLEPLAKKILTLPDDKLEILAKPYLTDKVKTIEEALKQASYIIAEIISDNADYRKKIRFNTYKNGIIISKLKKNANDEKLVYEIYYDYKEPVKYIKPHRVLALNRGEKEKILIVNIEYDENQVYEYLERKIIKNKNNELANLIKDAIKDSYKRLIKPSIEREVRNELTEKSQVVAIDNFGKNLEKLLLTPPMKEKIVLGFDPAFRTGCKLAIVDKTGKKIHIDVIYPNEPQNEYEKSKKKVLDLIDQFKIDIVAIGNGTASRESEKFIADVIKEANRKVEYIIVNEAGASVYSASKLAIKEFPNLHVEQRSAISIARRLQDPLAELVKIDPESIGVGLYQHDVPNKELTSSLDFVVSKVVNMVGVNINTASQALLKYVSGITKPSITKLLNYRDKYGKFKSRQEIGKLLSEKAYEQSIGFLRILDGTDILDSSAIHPESYPLVLKLLDKLNLKLVDIGTDKLIKNLEKINIESYSKELKTDIYTLEDIIEALKKPQRDPRDEMPKPILKSDILKLEDLKKGMKLQGTVRNVAPFGAFIDIGLKNDGLAHISKLTKKFIKDPMEVVNVGDIVDCYVDEIYLEKGKVALSLIEP